MNQTVRHSVATVIAGAVALFLLVPLSAAQQAGASGAQAPALPRTADGKPDLSGIWQTLTTANWDIEPRSATWGVPASVGIVEGGTLPYQPGARARKDENFRNRMTTDTEARCFLPGVPRIMYMPYPFQIVQTPKLVVMLFEYLHATRNVFMDTAHLDGPLEWWMGESRGRWEGDTLVVSARHFNTDTWFDRAGNYHSEDMQVTERYTLLNPDHLRYTATIDDPKVFTRPWTMSMLLYRRAEPRFQLLDYECYAFFLDDEPIVVPPGVKQ
jgi:hypothetical protein